MPLSWVATDGNTEFFINLGANTHLDSVYGGYCVFAAVAENDTTSWAVVDAIADAIAKQGKSKISILSAKVA